MLDESSKFYSHSLAFDLTVWSLDHKCWPLLFLWSWSVIAITNHVVQENHVIDWDNAKILDRDSNLFTKKVREAIQIRTRGTKALNRDDRVYSLDHVYNPLLKRHQLPGNETTSSRAQLPGKSSGQYLWSIKGKMKLFCLRLMWAYCREKGKLNLILKF